MVRAMNPEATIVGYKGMESKEGRKISNARLKRLKDARDVLDAMIKEAEPAEAEKARVNPLLKNKRLNGGKKK